jgi:hypothetical protein
MYFWFPWWKTLSFTLWVIFVDCVGIGAAIATVCWYIANRYLRYDSPPAGLDPVPWLR